MPRIRVFPDDRVSVAAREGSGGRRARRALAAWLASALLAAALSAPAQAGLDVGDAAPALCLPTGSGTSFRLADELRDHGVLLSFVSPRCKPCEESRPALESLLRRANVGGDLGLELASVMLGTEREGAGAPEALDRAAGFEETLLVGDDAAAEAFGVFGTPVFFLVNRQGTIVWKHVGRLLPEAVDQALDGARRDTLAMTR